MLPSRVLDSIDTSLAASPVIYSTDTPRSSFLHSSCVLDSINSFRTMFVSLGASIPILTLPDPILTTVIVMSGPIWIDSSTRLVKTNMLDSFR